MELTLAEYGLWDDEIDDTLRMQLFSSWLHRKRFEARLNAIELGIMLAGGQRGGAREVAPDEFLAIAGKR